MRLKQPAAPFERLEFHGDSVSLDTEGKVLVLPSGNPDILPSHNEYTLNSNRLTIAESPFGGLKGPGSPDYAPGTVNIIDGDGVYLQDVSGTNSSKTLSAGKLKELGLLTVDTTNHTITEEFIVANTGTSNNPTVIDSCDATSNFTMLSGTGALTIENGRIKVIGTANASGSLSITKTFQPIDISSNNFLCFNLESSVSGAAYIKIASDSNGLHRKVWNDEARFPLTGSVQRSFSLPVNAPQGTTGSLPSFSSGDIDLSNVVYFAFGITGLTAFASVTIYLDNITVDTAKSAYVELQIPDNLSATSATLFTHNGTQYLECRSDSLDGAYSNVSRTTANATLADGTKFDDVYGAGLGRAVYPKGESGETKNGSIGSITYSANKGTSKRIGFRVDLPPSDGGRTNFNKCRIKAVLSYAPDAENNYSASYDFADSTNTSYGLQNLSKPWIALYDPASSLIDFYLFTHRPKNLSFKRNDDGTIHEVTLYPGNGLIYHGQITYANLTADSNSDGIPDCLEASVEGSITKFLQAYGMVE